MEIKRMLTAAGIGEPTDIVELHISCEKLKDMDVFSKSDPVCEVYLKNHKDDQNWHKIGETEQIENNLNPIFVKSFEISYYFEREQMLKFMVHDVDVLSRDHIGDFEVSLGKIMGSHNQTLEGDLRVAGKAKSRGKIKLSLQKVSTNNDVIYFDLSLKNLKSHKICIFGSNDPFFFVERSRTPDSEHFIRVLESDKRSSTTAPTWHKLKYMAKSICNGDINNRLTFKFYSWKSNGYHKPYGEFTTSLAQLINGDVEYVLHQIGSPASSTGATASFDNLFIEQRPSFYDFLHSGWEINLTVAIDFTSSNGTPNYPDSLHYLNPSGIPNQYQSALYSVGGILQNYDTDKKIPAFGFGAIPSYAAREGVSHCFHLNGAPNPECDGIEGLMQAYNFSLANVKFYGPTFFEPFMQTFVNFVGENLNEKLYHILLILTDGDIHDMSKTKDLIVGASGMPISIIIIGIGDDEFELMVELDGDEVILKNHKGEPTQRDIVQFVKFNEYKDEGITALSEEVLKEVPEQVISFLTANKVQL